MHHQFEAEIINLQNLAVQEKDGRQGLILSGSADVVFDRKVRQKYLYFRYAHVSRMPLLTEEDKALYPTYIGLFGSPTVVPDANRISQFIKQHPTQLPPEGCNPNAMFQACQRGCGACTPKGRC